MPDLFHFDIPTWGNYGDKALFPVVRDTFRVFDGDAVFTSSAALRREVDTDLVDRINARADAVVVGGGGLFLQDTNTNRLSGWQWKISADTLARIDVPLISYALGDNRFPGQPEFDDLLRAHVRQVHEQAIFFGLRNTGSMMTMSQTLDLPQEAIAYQPCPTTLAGLTYAPLRGRRPDPRERTIAIQMLVHARQQAAGFDADVIHSAVIAAARILVDRGWTVLSTPFHPDDEVVSRRLVAEVPGVEGVRLCGADVGFFAGFDLFSTIPYVLGGRGHAQMIPFGVGSIPISLDVHAKLGYFAGDIGHPELVVPVGPEGMGDDSADEATRAADAEPSLRVRVLAERIVDAVEGAYSRGVELQDDLAGTRQRFWELTRTNHAAIAESLGRRPAGARAADARPRNLSDIAAEEFHVSAVAEAEEFSAAQTREFAGHRRDKAQEIAEIENAAALAQQAADVERDELRTALEQTRSQVASLVRDRDAVRRNAESSARRLAEVEDRNAKEEAKVLLRKSVHAVRWRVRRLRGRRGRRR